MDKKKIIIIISAFILIVILLLLTRKNDEEETQIVTPNPVISVMEVKLNREEMVIDAGTTGKLSVMVNPVNATNQTVTWTSSDESIVSVDEGTIKALKKGEAIITVKSVDGNKIATCKVTVKEEVGYKVTFDANGGEVSISSKIVKENDKYGELPIPTKKNARFIGWFTTKNGKFDYQYYANTYPELKNTYGYNEEQLKNHWLTIGQKEGKKCSSDYVNSESIFNKKEDITLYAKWDGYVITNDSKYSGYANIAMCSSDTLKYRIIDYNKIDVVLIWVENANSQLGSALASPNGIGSTSAEALLSKEITDNSYQNKCMVAVNASFFHMNNGEIRAGVLVNKGRTVVNNSYGAHATIGVNKNNILKEYTTNDSAITLINDGVMNNFRISGKASFNDSGDVANRTQICQYDENNFVLISGSGTVGGVAKRIYELTGCKNTWNLDGGGSRKLYYKDKTMPTMTRIFGGDRKIPDMLYFVE